MKVAVIMGSSSDWPIMKEACDMLEYFNINMRKGRFCTSNTIRNG